MTFKDVFDLMKHDSKYVYLEASAPRKQGDRTWLLSQNFNPTKAGCFSFWYNMNGHDIGTLAVYISFIGGGNRTIWSLSSDHGNKWINGQAPIVSTAAYKIVIEGVRGSGIAGDIAIDDLLVSSSLCGVLPSEAQPGNQTGTLPPTGSTTPATTPGSFTCNFDTGPCGWTQDKTTDTFDWLKKSGSTNSVGTGPRSDHTGSGSYYYIETSPPRHRGDKARFISPTVPVSVANSPKCFKFWYNMYGDHIGTLNVYMKTGLHYSTAVFNRTGTQGQAWKEANVNLVSAIPFQVALEATYGNGYRGDIAVDDVSIVDGSCQQGPGLSGFIGCNFENANLCGYTQDHSDQFDWTRKSGSTGTRGTGPTNDHTYGSSRGHYMYIEASSPRRPGDVARLISAQEPATGQTSMCVEFWYHMYGRTTGTLSLYLRHGTSNGDQGNRWVKATYGVAPNTPAYNLVFEATRGSGYVGDIAIDDVSVKNGACSSSAFGNCNFELDLCTWSNVHTGDDFDWITGSGSTTSTGTGPQADHTLNNSNGTYIYIESSAPQRPGDRAVLQSATLQPTSGQCLHFWYNMFGSRLGTLQVWKQPQGGNATKIWELSGNQGNLWKNAVVPIGSMTTAYQVLVVGIRGNSYMGDIAVDDFTFNSSSCILSPPGAMPVSTTPAATTLQTLRTPTAYVCDFETNLCAWTQDKTDNFDWTRQHGPTISANTGPATDHTKGTNLGYYIFIEASSPRRPGDKARLISPATDGSIKQCFTFWYHMYGTNIKALNVYFKSNNNSLGAAVWTRQGTQGRRWIQGQVQIPGGSATHSVTNVVIEGVRGTSYLGDIAVDDVNLFAGSCSAGTTASPGSLSTAINCDFESANICNYQQDKTTDVFDWTRKNLATTSRYTGPSNDHTYGTSAGHYMYIEASSPRHRGDSARLMTPVFSPSSQQCLSFWFHMYGNTMGTLNVYAVQNSSNSNYGAPIWTLSGNQGNVWLQEYVPLPSYSAQKIVFEGLVGRGIQSDIAIDDVKLAASCPTHGDCSFENGSCGWRNDKTDSFDWVVHQGQRYVSRQTPTGDHTFGLRKGHYLYFNGRSSLSSGSKASYMSQIMAPTSSTGQCFTFFYTITGNNVGILNGIVQQGNTSTLMWHISFNPSAGWNQGQFPVTSATPFRVVLQLAKGTYRGGYVAIDDIAFSVGTCQVLPVDAMSGNTLPPVSTPSTTASPTTAPSQYDCNFDNGICTWTQNKDDQFDWTRKRGSTGTGGTGPSSDHTSGSGSYLYIEASSPRRNNDKARLSSATISTTGPKCLKFWYHMYGTDVKTLNVYTKVGSTYGTPVWSHTGTLSNKWYTTSVNIQANSTYQVVIEGVRGISYRGDIAIDDVSISDGSCQAAVSSCTFEDQKLCGYTQDRRDNFDWSWKSGHTSSANTGPSADHTYGSARGHYVYIESSRPRLQGQKARLLSTDNAPTVGSCLQFWYHMYGRQIGNLTIYVQQAGSRGSPIWSKSGNQGNKWIEAEVTVKAQSTWEAVFEGVIGSGYQSDIAIDDVKITAGACAGNGNCNFEKDTCLWSNIQGDDFDWLRKRGRTQTQFTGPSSDHTTGGFTGYYMFVETSAPRVPGDKAWLVSTPRSPTSTTTCMSFWYHMYGTAVGSLNVYVNTTSTGTLTTLWTLYGNQQNAWHQGQIPMVPQSSTYTIVFEGIRGTSYQGDIAIDDILFTPTSCGYLPATANPANASTTPAPSASPTPTPFVNQSKYDCSFETNLCSWTQAKDDIFDWTRAQGPTASVQTGPTNDHTLGTGQGWYMFIESSNPRKMNDTARLVSASVPSGSQQCLSFWYHMYGPNINRLNIYIKKGTSYGTPVWTRYGTQGNVWIQAHYPIPSQSSQYNIVFEGLTGAGYRGDIGLDDIKVVAGPCTSSVGLQCNFESSSLCGWSQDHSDNIDWISKAGRTSSSGTGPSTDHTTGTTSGHYVYIESSRPNVPGNKARLLSTSVAMTTPMCLQFYYHMYGKQMGTLNVYLRVGTTLPTAPIWSRSFNQGNNWILGQVTIQNSQAYTVVFEGVVGTGYTSDIAIDDINSISGACPDPGNCDFEKGLCTWTNVHDQTDQFDWLLNRGRTSSSITGPSNDHTTGNSAGHYIFIESSAPRRFGDRAVLKSQLFQATSARCLNFWYNMYGSEIGYLNAYIQPQNATNSTQRIKIWSLFGDQGNQWKSARSMYYSSVPFYVSYVLQQCVCLYKLPACTTAVCLSI
ncbi:MAM and LDL-receptor class A domain-containing protein 1-like [Pecten maximus]|uniref:MAM and LDL-receptor class A domain-containing protein 1-like n=1 Tax=Pecten maximus TaxID=6579 RepID=UPI001458C6FA|nr:MAM and LDL-receptor class A domain-containing protein 1-like [Pecten maximus]